MKKSLFMLMAIFLMSYAAFAEKPENTFSIFPMVGYSYYPHTGNANSDVTGGIEGGLGIDYAFLNNWTVELTWNDNYLHYDVPGHDKNFHVNSYGAFGAYWWEFTEGIYLKLKAGVVVDRGDVTTPYYYSNGRAVSGTGGYTASPTNNPPSSPGYSLTKEVMDAAGTPYYYTRKYSYDKTVFGGGLALDFQINRNSSWGVAFDVLDSYIWDTSLYYRWTFL